MRLQGIENEVKYFTLKSLILGCLQIFYKIRYKTSTMFFYTSGLLRILEANMLLYRNSVIQKLKKQLLNFIPALPTKLHYNHVILLHEIISNDMQIL